MLHLMASIVWPPVAAVSNPLDLNRNEGSGPYDRPYMTRQIQNANFSLMLPDCEGSADEHK